MGNTIIDDLLCCRDISVVLRKRPEGRQYVESYLLKNLVLSNGQFWGKFANVHPALVTDKLPQMNLLSYVYNNFSPVVCTMSLADRMERYYSADAYSEIKFRANGHYSRIWKGPGGDYNTAILEAVKSGLKMKALIESTDGYTYILPLHTVEVYEKEFDFNAETEFDGYPERLRHFKNIESLGHEFVDFLKKNKSAPYASTDFNLSEPYFLSSFLIHRKKVFHREHDKNSKLKTVEFETKNVELWAETN